MSRGTAVAVLVAMQLLGSAANAAESSDRSSSGDDHEWLNDPPGFLTWLSIAGNIGLFCWGLYQWRVSRRDRAVDKKGAIDQYWCESVLIPQLMTPIVSFLNDQCGRLKALDSQQPASKPSREYTEFLELYEVRYAELAAQLVLLSSFSRPHFNVIMDSLDKLDDAVTIYCHEQSIGVGSSSTYRMDLRFADTSSACVDVFRRMHFEFAGL